MSWFKVDDKLHSHPKALRAGLEAMGLWVLAGAHCASYGTEGRVDLPTISRLSGDVRRAKSLASRLVLAGLWRTSGADLWEFHDWLDHNLTADEEAERRKKYAASGRAGGLRSGQVRRTNAEANAEANASRVDEANAEANVKPVPSRPVPILKKERESEQRASAPPASRGSRLPDGWTPKPETIRRFAQREGVDATAAIEPFCLYWQAKAGAGATKVDWNKTFCSWVLRDLGRLPPAPIPEPIAAEPFISPDAVPMPPEIAAQLQALADQQTVPLFLREAAE